MKRNLLICTIARDVHSHLETWYSQIERLAVLLVDHYEVYLSVVENDSKDGTASWLFCLGYNQRLYALGGRIEVSTEVLGTQKYPSVWNEDRLRNLAAARQKCLDQAAARWGLGYFQKIAYVEPDVTYDPAWISELVLANHPRAAGLGEPDVYSGWSLRSVSHPKESLFLYDTCATRAGPNDTCWDVNEDCGRWRGRSLIPTGLPGVEENCLHRVWSTFNGFCVYNAKPFIEGARWGYVNHRLDTGQQKLEGGTLDADTSVMCETFRARGYNGVYLNTNRLIRHT